MEEMNYTENGGDKSLKKGIGLGIIIGVLISCAIFCGAYIIKNFVGNVNAGSSSVANAGTLKKMETIEKLLKSDMYLYNEDVTLDNLEDGVYRGMLEATGDVYAEYYSVKDFEVLQNDTEGISYGIGCVVSLTDDGLAEVVSVIENSPAEGADVQPGDIIMEVDGESMVGLTLTQIVKKIKGLNETPVEITFYRENELDYLVKTIIRGEAIQDTNVSFGTYLDDERIGYIFIKEFDDASTEQFIEALAELNEKNIEGLIIDLRGNPGGNVSSVVEICRHILPEGIIFYEEDNSGKRTEFRGNGENELNIPIAVLINKYSASASEIMAGSIRDYNKGTLIGMTTYGKGIVQTVKSLGDGSAIKYTKSAYFLPSGECIQGVGVAPDIEIDLDKEKYVEDGTDNQFDKAVEVIQGKIGE